METKKENRLSMKEKISYGLGDGAANIYVAMAMTFLTGYYTDTVGLAAAAIGTMMLVARLFDGVTDLIMGAIVDKTKSKYGKARPWVLWTAPLMAIGLVALFRVPEGLSDGGLVSQDPVAIDSVGADFLINEPAVTDNNRALKGNPNVENYLHEAGLVNQTPSGTVYENGNGEAVVNLGVHEHWNNSVEKKYSRNLGKKEGIELVSIIK